MVTHMKTTIDIADNVSKLIESLIETHNGEFPAVGKRMLGMGMV
jgi:hypothetical protein